MTVVVQYTTELEALYGADQGMIRMDDEDERRQIADASMRVSKNHDYFSGFGDS